MIFAYLPSYAFVGLVFRRWWGGWEGAKHWIKLTVGALLAYASMLPVMVVTGQWWFGAPFAVIATLAWLNPWHAAYERYGHPDAPNPNPSFAICALVHGASYSMYTLALAALMFGLTGFHQPLYFVAAPLGFIAPIGYMIGWKLYDHNPKIFPEIDTETGPNDYFLDSPTSVGECTIGTAIGVSLATLVCLCLLNL